MKKKYFAPEMEELEFDEPVVLADKEGSVEGEGVCTSHVAECGTNVG